MGKQANGVRLHWLRVRLITDSGGGKRGQGIPGAKKRTEQRTVKNCELEVCILYSIVSTGLRKPGRSKLPKNNEYRGRIQRKTWCMGPYAVVDYNLPLVDSCVDSNTFTMGNPMPESTLSICQNLSPVRDLGFVGL